MNVHNENMISFKILNSFLFVARRQKVPFKIKKRLTTVEVSKKQHKILTMNIL